MQSKTQVKGKKVLLVDDDFDYLTQQKVLLENSGYQVIAAESRREAEHLASQVQPDIAIIDLMLEERDGGFILSYHFKQKYPKLPIIIVTAVTSETGIVFDNPANADQSWMKCDAILSKPIRHEQLLKEMERLLG